MRFLIHEMSIEKPLAAGRYDYRRNGQKTGAVESWRMTEVVDGYLILRVDLDARQAESGDSYLYHLILNPAGQPERLNFRFFRPDLRIQGNVLFESGRVILSREINGERQDGEADFRPGTLFWFPASAGLSLIKDCLGACSAHPALTLDRDAQFALRPVTVSIATGVPEKVAVRGIQAETQPVTMRWEDRERRVWLDQHRWPVQVQRDDLWAITTQYARYN